MSYSSSEVVEQITEQVFKEKKGFLDKEKENSKDSCFVNENKLCLEAFLNKYGQLFYEALNEHSSEITYGLLLGLTKRFIEFCFKHVFDLCKLDRQEHAERVLTMITSNVAPKIAASVDEGIGVYVIYRDLKKVIDGMF